MAGDAERSRMKAAGAPSTAVAETFSWLRGLPLPAPLARSGIAVGQKWTSEHELTGLPFTDVVWRAESTYLRDEACGSPTGAENAGSAPGSQDTCGVILTRFAIARRGGEHADATPQDYREHGLRTSGKLTGSGESLDAVSRATGQLVSSTQTSTEDSDYEIAGISNHQSDIHHVAHVEAQTEIAALPPDSSGS
jgi:hypothetical protein